MRILDKEVAEKRAVLVEEDVKATLEVLVDGLKEGGFKFLFLSTPRESKDKCPWSTLN